MAEIIQGSTPLASLGGSFTLTQANVTAGTVLVLPVTCQRLFLNIATAATTISVLMLDGSTAALGSLPIGVYQFDIQFVSVTAGTPTSIAGAVGFYRVDG